MGVAALTGWLRRRIDDAGDERRRGAQPPAGVRRPGGAGADHPPQQGAGVPDRLPALPVGSQLDRPSAGAGRLPRRRRAPTSTSGWKARAYQAAPPSPHRRAARGGPAPGLRGPDARPASGRRVVGGHLQRAATPRWDACCSPASADGSVADERAARRPTTTSPSRASRSSPPPRPGASACSAPRPGARRTGAARRPSRPGWRSPSSTAALDRGWRRTSYSDITAAAHEAWVAQRARGAGARRRAGPARRRRGARRRPRRAARPPVAVGASCPPGRASARSCTSCWRRPTSPPPTWAPSWTRQVGLAQARRVTEAGDRATLVAALRGHAARRRCRGWGRWPRDSPAPTASTSCASSCRWPAATRPSAGWRPR